MDPVAYLNRIGVDPETARTPDLETLERIQRAHVTAVPFENPAIVGDPYGDREGEGVALSIPHLYEKIVERRRGGYCFERNGLFNWLLDELGYDDVSRELRYFEATNDFLQRAPESPFTDGGTVSVATEEGHRKLSADSLTEMTGGAERERIATGEEWHATLGKEFGLSYDR